MNQIKITALVLMIVVLSASTLWAQNIPSIKQITGLQLIEYGQALYERGQYKQAASILTRALKLQPTNKKAIKIAEKLNKKGEHIYIPKDVKSSTDEQSIQQAKVMVVKPVTTLQDVKVSLALSYTSEDLRSQIQEANKQVDQLKEEIASLNEQLLN